MPLRTLIRLLTSRYGEDAVEKLAESRPMRRAAQLTAYLYHRGKAAGEDSVEKFKESKVTERAQTFQKTFSEELREGFKDLNKDIKKQRQQK